MATINNDTFIPWGLHPVKPWVIEELKKRGDDYGLANKTDSNGVKRSGVRTPWVRFFSNGIAPEDKALGLEGFLMGGSKNFNDAFGFNKGGESTIGYDANGKPHISYAVESFPNRPPPVIDSVDVEIISGQSSPFSGMCRKAVVKWKAFSLDHLRYLTPYFLSPKVTCLIEWGWDNYSPASLLSYDVLTLRKAFGNPKLIMENTFKSRGNYDAHFGYITEYNYKINGNGVYECSTTILSVAWLFEGQDYGNQTLKRTENNKEIRVESFKEFNKYNKWDNLSTKAPVPPALNRPPPNYMAGAGGAGIHAFTRTNSQQPQEETGYPGSYGRVFEIKKFITSNRRWVKMDYFVEILNHFFEIRFKDLVVDNPAKKDGEEKKPFTWLKINIDHVLISAHPGLKSIDPEVIVPNQYAPKYIYADTKGKKASTGKLDSVQFEKVNYFEKFKKIQKVINDNNFTNDYDDLFALMSSKITEEKYKGRSFPIFSESGLNELDKQPYQKNIGYCGYLKDLYISTDFIKRIVEENSTVKGLLDTILKKISGALSGIVELRIVPNTNQANTEITVMDVKFAPVLDREEISRLPRIIPGSSNHSFIITAGMDVKMSPEMANQVIFTAGSEELKKREEEEKKNKAQGKETKQETSRTVPVTDAESFGKFVSQDRLAPTGNVAQKNESADKKPDKQKLTRNTSDEGFNIYTENNVDHYLNEPSKTLMRQIIMEDEAPAAVYANSAIMPNTEFEFETLGIGGFTFLGMFTLDHVPYPYTWENGVWQISKIRQTITPGNWKISVGAQIRKVSTFLGQ